MKKDYLITVYKPKDDILLSLVNLGDLSGSYEFAERIKLSAKNADRAIDMAFNICKKKFPEVDKSDFLVKSIKEL